MASAKRTPSLGAARIADDVDLTIMAPCSTKGAGVTRPVLAEVASMEGEV